MSLLALQRDMRVWLIEADETAAARFGGAETPGLGVYQNNYRAALVSCLQSSFEHTRRWLGEDAFLRAAIHHIDRVPPSSWTLDAYARDFPDTLAILYKDDGEVPELARIELALEDAFVAPDGTALSVDTLQDRDWDHAVLILSPTLDFITLRTNAFAIWAGLLEGSAPPAAQALETPVVVAVWRLGFRTHARELDVDEEFALAAIRTGLSFSDLCERTAARRGREQGIVLAARWLGQWITDGLITEIDDGA